MNSPSYVYLSEALEAREFGFKEEVFEDETGKHKKLVAEGIFQTAGKANRNKRVYSEALLRRETGRLNSKIKESGILLGEMEHPIGNPEDPQHMSRATKILQERACIGIKHLEFNGNDVYGKAEVLEGDNSFGDKLAANIRHGFIPGISSRGVGGKPMYMGNGTIEVPFDSYTMITFDEVESPSNWNSRLNAIMEAEEFNYQQQTKYVKKLWTGFESLAKKLN